MLEIVKDYLKMSGYNSTFGCLEANNIKRKAADQSIKKRVIESQLKIRAQVSVVDIAAAEIFGEFKNS